MALFSPAKADLPIYNSKLYPKRPSRGLIRMLWVGGVCLLLMWVMFRRGTFSGSSENPSNDDYELYTATKDGITKEDTSGLGSLTDELGGDDHVLSPEEQDKIYKDTVEFYDLDNYQGSASNAASNGDIVLFLMPLRNAEHVLPMAFHNIMNLTYDHSLIDIAFLVSDCSPGDTTLETVFEYAVALQNGTLADQLLAAEAKKRSANVKGTNDLYQLYMEQSYVENVERAYNSPESYHAGYRTPFRSVTIYVKDFGQVIGQGFSDRHAVKVQGIRRKLMGRARNWLTSSALKPYHSWVYWRDVDIETCPGTVIQDLMKFDYDVMVPNIWRPLPKFLGSEQPYDLNSWVESDPALELAKTLDEDDVIVEGYAEYPTYRVHLAYIRNPEGNPDEVVDLDGVGGVSILAKAKIFRQGVHFPAFTLWNHAETEAFGKMARAMGFRVGGLPHYTIWHIYEPSEDDLKRIATMERKKRRQKSH